MKQIAIKRLFKSFQELERAIDSARATLGNKEKTPRDVLERIDVYDEILHKQRRLALSLCEHAAQGKWQEVSRHVHLINGLSGMIRDDARDILAGIRAPMTPQEKELTLS